jgi:hypothetical protein
MQGGEYVSTKKSAMHLIFKAIAILLLLSLVSAANSNCR